MPRIGPWFAASATLFLCRAMLFSTWLSQGPQVQSALGLSTAQMGWFVMLFPLGGLLGISYASTLTERLGSMRLGMLGFGLSALCLAGLGLMVPAGQVLPSALLLLLMGLPMAVMDYLGNYEGTRVDKASAHSLLPAIHSAFGLGMMAAAQLSSELISRELGLAFNFWLVAAFAGPVAMVASLVFSRMESAGTSPATMAGGEMRAWREGRTLLVALIGFSFIMAEISAGIWAPIALAQSGSTQAAAASALGLLWVLVTLGRAMGGFIVDRFGRTATMVGSTLLTAAGVAVFMLDGWLHLSHAGLVLWGSGLAMGFPLAVACMGDDPARAPARINLIISVVYLASMVVGPALGSLGQMVGIHLAFSIPLAFMLLSSLLSARLGKAQPAATPTGHHPIPAEP